MVCLIVGLALLLISFALLFGIAKSVFGYGRIDQIAVILFIITVITGVFVTLSSLAGFVLSFK